MSDENAYSVRHRIPISSACSTIRRAVSTPTRCPATRGNPCRAAQRPFPSMMIATCSPGCLFPCMAESLAIDILLSPAASRIAKFSQP
ncbi:hypothetical protein SBA5_180033 [Candidatus Sulfotelmatomonas gaucii]|uniref:Uncharacterized protein n=1 Tax=Candidatus Sulfuritelmatomonas gaucii TaxID=2043161 RepID=A0A2N9L6W7_9BACT|nr:hypothetical protein SBA5_180033 [Candidatus Sulfotelmatomonas gaucii]